MYMDWGFEKQKVKALVPQKQLNSSLDSDCSQHYKRCSMMPTHAPCTLGLPVGSQPDLSMLIPLVYHSCSHPPPSPITVLGCFELLLLLLSGVWSPSGTLLLRKTWLRYPYLDLQHC